MSHANAALTPRARLRVAQLVVDQKVPIPEVAARFQCSYTTVKRWAARYAAGESMQDRSSRPHTMPTKTPPAVTKQIVSLRLRKRFGPVQLAARVGSHPRPCTGCWCGAGSTGSRTWTGPPVNRCAATSTTTPGSMLHVDVKKLGNIPDGGGWRYVGRVQGWSNRAATPGKPKNAWYGKKMGTAFVHTVIDDHSRVAYAEVHDDETAVTATAVLRNAVAWFAQRGVTVERVLSDNGSAYVSFLWRDVCAELGIKHSRTRPYRPQTNGKIERFHRTLSDGWGYARCYTSESERRQALPAWLHEYNHHRPHTACGNKPPITRLTNLPGQYI